MKRRIRKKERKQKERKDESKLGCAGITTECKTLLFCAFSRIYRTLKQDMVAKTNLTAQCSKLHFFPESWKSVFLFCAVTLGSRRIEHGMGL